MSGQVRPFADFLQDINGGATHTELGEALKELVAAVDMYGKVGTLTYVVKVKPAGKNSEGTVLISDDLKVKAPTGDRSESIFFLDIAGNVRRERAEEMRMPLREVPGAVVVVDEETGEIAQ